MKILKIIAVLFLMMPFSHVLAQDVLRISPDEAVERAIKNNLSLESSRLAVSTKKRASDVSWNQFVPSITAGGSLVVNNERSKISGTVPIDLSTFVPALPANTVFGNSAAYSAEGPQWNLAIPIQASLTLTVAMFENMNRLKLDYQGGLIAYEKAKLQLERDIRKAYNNMLLLQENISLLKDNYENAARRVQMAQANYNAGLSPELVYLQTRVAMENMKPVIDQAENGYRLSLANFAMYLGLPYDTEFELIPLESPASNENVINFIPLDVKELIKKAASGKPDIQELRHNLLMLQSVRKIQANSLLPYLNFNYGFTPYYTPPFDIMGTRRNGEWGKSGSLTITLGIRLHSLFPFSSDYQGIKDMDDQIKDINIILAQVIQGTEIEIYNTILSLNRIQITAETQLQTITLAERSYRLTDQAYRSGLQDFLQVQNAELELKQAKVSMLEQQFNYLNGLLDLEYSIGVPYGTLVQNSSKEN